MPGWFYKRYAFLALTHERNYAAWWSGMCLFIAALLFYRLASQPLINQKDRFMWATLAIIMAGLSLDEIGSLHERLSSIGGWWLLAPFGFVGISMTLYSFWRLVTVPKYRVSAILILLGLGVFVGVAGLEFVEHNFDLSKFWKLTRAIVEENAELVGVFMFIVAGYRQLRLTGSEARISLLEKMQINSLGFITHILFFGLFVEIALALSVDIDRASSGRGSPLSWFPAAVFFVGFILCMYSAKLAHGKDYRWLWRIAAVVFILASMGQLPNHGKFLSGYLEFLPQVLYQGGMANVYWMSIPTIIACVALVGIRSWQYVVLISLSIAFFYFETPPGNIYYVVSAITAVALVKCLSEYVANDITYTRRKTQVPGVT